MNKLGLFLLFPAFCLLAVTERILIESPQEVLIYDRQNQVWNFPAVVAPARVLVSFEQRLDFPYLGGWAPCWGILVNKQPITSMATRRHTRLLNKSRTAKHLDHVRFLTDIGEKWYALYSPDYDGAKSRFSPYNPEAYRMLLDITDLVHHDRENSIQIRFGADISGYYKQMNIKRAPALGVRNFKVIQDDTPSLIPRPAKESDYYIQMKDLPSVKYELDVQDKGLLVRFGEKSTPIHSLFSVPGGQWAAIGAENSLETPFYKVERKIVRQKNRIDLFDTLTSLSDQLIGVKIRHESPDSDFADIYLGGDATPNCEEYAGGRNPSVFLADKSLNQSIALIAQDDVFRVQNLQYCKNGKTGIRTDTFALSPGESRTVEWSVYPLMSADYFDFINEVRRDWDVNFTIDGGFHLSLNLFRDWTPEAAWQFHQKAGLKYNSLGVFFWSHLGGEYAKRGSAVFSTSFFDEESRGRLIPNTITQFNNEPMRQFLGEILRKAKSALPELKRFVYVHNQYSNELNDHEKYSDCVISKADGTSRKYPPYNFFIPTTENAFGRKFMDFLQRLIDEYNPDGIYHDEFTYTQSTRTYNMWDKVSVELDENHEPVRKIGFIPLLKLDFNMQVMDYVLNQRGKLFIANFSPETRSERKFKFPRFEETFYSNWVYLSHLYTPIQLGDLQNYSITPEGHIADIRNALRNGTLYYHYNNLAACPTITSVMFPFTPIEIHGGWLIGKERILTIYSGEYAWKGENALCVPFVYDEQGKQVPDYPVTFAGAQGETVCRLLLQPEYCAALVKIPVAAKLSDEAQLKNVVLQDGRFTAELSGKGSAHIVLNNQTEVFAAGGKDSIQISLPR